MDKHFHILDNEGREIAKNLVDECAECIATCSNAGKMVICPKYGGERRQGKIINSKGTTFLCDTTKTTRLFRDKIEGLSYAFADIIVIKSEIEEGIKRIEQQKVNRLVHNLTSINGKNIQEIYNLVSQDILSSNWKTQLEYIEKEIINEPKKAAMLFLRIAKNNIQMKSEFSIYKRLDRADANTLEIRNYPIRSTLLNVLHPFFVDFNESRIYVNVNEYFGRCMFDYETIQVCLYHFFENTTKYARPNSTIEINFEEEGNFVKVIYSMSSAYIMPNECDTIFDEGVSGEVAKEMGKNGDGIGMWRIKQIMKLNHGNCELIAGNNPTKYMGHHYCDNTFIMSFVKADVSRRRY